MRHALPSPAKRAFAAVVVGLVSAACATTRYTQSRLETEPHAAKTRVGEAVTVEVEGLKVRVGNVDRAPRGQVIPNLGLRLVFEPDALGYSFDPGQVVLRSADGREWRSRGGEYRPVYPKARFDLAFDATVSKAASFDLVLGGLARAQKRLEPVTLRLARREGRSYDRLYWLEAIGYAVALPLAGAGGGL